MFQNKYVKNLVRYSFLAMVFGVLVYCAAISTVNISRNPEQEKAVNYIVSAFSLLLFVFGKSIPKESFLKDAMEFASVFIPIALLLVKSY